MDWLFIIQIIFTGIGAGMFAGMFGIGGAIIILPVLVLVFGWDFYHATGTSLAALLLPAGWIALYNYKKNKLIYFKGSGYTAIGMVLGNLLGAFIALYIVNDAYYLKFLFGLFMICMGMRYLRPIFLFNKLFNPSKNIAPASEVIYNEPQDIKVIFFTMIGFASGILAGMFGIGGGLLITIILVGIFKLNPKQAVAISLAAMFLPVAICGVVLNELRGNIDWVVAIIIAFGIEIGSSFSSRIAIKLKADVYKHFFGLMMILCGIYFCWEIFYTL